MKLFLHQLAVMGILMFAYLLQIQIIAPLEGWLHEAGTLAAGSLLFLPFGASAVCVALSGLKVSTPLLVMVLFPGLSSGFAGVESLLLSLGPIASLLIAVMLINLITRNALGQSLSVGAGKGVNLLYLVLGTAALASILNLLLSSILLDASQQGQNLYGHFGANMLGTLAFIGLLLMLKKPLIKALYFLGRKHA